MDTSPAGYRKRFIEKITYYSNADNYKDGILEWYLTEVRIADNDSNIHCICNKSIKKLCYIKNIHNGTSLIIGSDCSAHIGKSMNKEALLKIDKLENPEKFCKVCYSKMRKVTNKDEYNCTECAKQIIDCGKYKNKSYKYVYDKDKSYWDWIKNHDNLYGGLLKFQLYILNMKS